MEVGGRVYVGNICYCPVQSVYPVCFPEYGNKKYVLVGTTVLK
jgi:hypothetical protein